MRHQCFRQEDCLWLLARVCERLGLPFSANDALDVAGDWPDTVSGSELAGALTTLGVAAAPGRLPGKSRSARKTPFIALLRSEAPCPRTGELIEERIPVLVLSADGASVSVSTAGDGEPLVLDRGSFDALACRDVLAVSSVGMPATGCGMINVQCDRAANDGQFPPEPAVAAGRARRKAGGLHLARRG